MKTNLALILAVSLTVLMIVSYNMLEWMEKYHPKLVANIYYGVVAVVLFGLFYLIGMFIRGMRNDEEDSSDDLWPK